MAPGVSSLRCADVITDLLGSYTSSLCSPNVMSHSAITPARNLLSPSKGSSVLLILAVNSFSISCWYCRAVFDSSEPSASGCLPRAVEEVAAHIHYGDRFGGQAFHRARDQVA